MYGAKKSAKLFQPTLWRLLLSFLLVTRPDIKTLKRFVLLSHRYALNRTIPSLTTHLEAEQVLAKVEPASENFNTSSLTAYGMSFSFFEIYDDARPRQLNQYWRILREHISEDLNMLQSSYGTPEHRRLIGLVLLMRGIILIVTPLSLLQCLSFSLSERCECVTQCVIRMHIAHSHRAKYITSDWTLRCSVRVCTCATLQEKKRCHN